MSGPASCRGVVPARTFESILTAVRPSGAALQRIAEAGYTGNPDDLYPLRTWCEVLEVLRMDRFSALPEALGYRALGHAFLDGFAETVVGRVICLMLPWMGPERMLISFPRYAAHGRPDARIEMKPAGERCWRAHVHMPGSVPEFTAGVLERGLNRTGATGTVTVENVQGEDFDLVARW
jgi:uncharacterized protein (TIGR02265 family)